MFESLSSFNFVYKRSANMISPSLLLLRLKMSPEIENILSTAADEA